MNSRICPRVGTFGIVIAIIAASFICGCGHSTGDEPYYNITVQNLRDGSVSNVVLSFGDYEWNLGEVGAGITKTEVGCMEPVPSSLTLSWTFPDGSAQRREIRLVESLAPNFDGALVLKFEPDGTVTLDFERKMK